MYKLLFVVLLSILLSGCSILDSWTYKLNTQQGNITEQKNVDKLEIGMTKEQVKFVLGTAMSVDSFNHNRWDYIYTYKAGNNEPSHNNLTVYFENNKLTKIEGEALVKSDKSNATDKDLEDEVHHTDTGHDPDPDPDN